MLILNRKIADILVNWYNNTSNDSLHSSYVNLFADIGVSQLILEPTHRCGNTLDLLLSDTPDIVHDIIVHHPGSFINSDHSPLTFGIRTFIKRKKASKRSIYNYKKANWKDLNRDLNRVDWHFILNSVEPDTGWNIFKTKFLLFCDKHIPKIKIKESFQPPWFDSDVFKLNKKKEHFRKLFKETNDTKYYKKFSSLRKQLKFLIKSKMRSNYDDELSPNTITKKFWSSVKSVTKSSRIPDKMYLNDCIRTEPEEIANLFNKHFFDQFSDKSSYDIDIDFTNDAFYDFSFDKLTIYNHLKQINPNKSQGPDKIGGLVIKNCAISISLPLSILFNISYRTGIIPAEWKTANIVPVHKKGDKSSINNYRPISLTSILSKIFEKCIRDELLTHCKHLLYDNQHGFLPNKSCTTQLLPFSHDISLSLNSCGLIDVVYFDFAKAFDTVSHDIILEKLKYQFNVDGLMLKIIKNYLKGRTQQVLVNGKLSAPLSVKSGVPQGSILGPLLFVLFINDMQTVISEHTKIALYADDTKIWRHINSPIDHEILQRDIDALCNWAKSNKMKFHPDKCKILSINNFNKNLFHELPFYYYPYQLYNTILDYSTEEKDLGILTTPKFSFKLHQTYILNKAITQFNLLRRTCHFINNTCKRRTLYLTLVRSLFNHCSQIWRPVGPAVVPFENFQKRCIKWALRESFVCYSQTEYLEKLRILKILPLEYYFLEIDLIVFHKIIHNLIPVPMPKELIHNDSRTRSNKNKNLTFQLTENVGTPKKILTNSFFIRSMSHWNRLPNEIREMTNPNEFKITLENHFWTQISSHLQSIPDSDREPD